MKIFVTGATGFLGGHLVSALLLEGHEVVALVRSEAAARDIAAAGATPILGGLKDSSALELTGVNAVIHTAAYFRFTGPRAAFVESNVDGTRELLHAAQSAGVSTFIHISAGGVIMDDAGSNICNATEDAPTYPNSFSGYIASKAQAEALVLAANSASFRTLALRPPAIWGPGDSFSRLLPAALQAGQFMFFDRGDYPFSTCHVNNVIEAIALALTKGEGGQAYFIHDQETGTFREFVSMIASANGAELGGVRSIPYSLAFFLGRVMEIGWKVARRKDDPPLSRSLVRMIGRQFTTDDTAARKDLGYVGQTSRAEGVRLYIES